jgi:hypothetical protein
MAMPEAAFDLDYYLVFRQDDVGVAWKIARMETEPESEPVKCVPHKKLGLRILRANTCHVRRALCTCLFTALPLVCHIVIMRHSERIGWAAAWGHPPFDRGFADNVHPATLSEDPLIAIRPR